MELVLVSESTTTEIPPNVEKLVLSLDEDLLNKNDHIIILLYVMMIETGFTPLNLANDVATAEYSFNKKKLHSLCHMPKNWKNIRQRTYEMCFTLGHFVENQCRLLVIPIDDVLIVNSLISNIEENKNNYSMSILTSRYILDSHAKPVATRFRTLRELSATFKDTVAQPSKNVILAKEGLINASLLGIPYELKINICKYLSSFDLITLSEVCQDLHKLHEDQSMWKALFLRDFKTVKDELEADIDWKEEYKQSYIKQKKQRPPTVSQFRSFSLCMTAANVTSIRSKKKQQCCML